MLSGYQIAENALVNQLTTIRIVQPYMKLNEMWTKHEVLVWMMIIIFFNFNLIHIFIKK